MTGHHPPGVAYQGNSPLQSAPPPPRGMALDHLVSHRLLWSPMVDRDRKSMQNVAERAGPRHPSSSGKRCSAAQAPDAVQPGGRDNGEAFPAASASSHRAFWPRSIELSSSFGKLFNDPADHPMERAVLARVESRFSSITNLPMDGAISVKTQKSSRKIKLSNGFVDMFARYAWKLSGFEGCLLPLLGWLAWLFVTKYLLVAANPAIWIFDQGTPCLRRSVPDEMGAPKHDDQLKREGRHPAPPGRSTPAAGLLCLLLPRSVKLGVSAGGNQGRS
ncbi:uncharacterized protein CLUP02_16035 [Colletotrichum lupini]|uniref:Uncharacterized protein n=1 Tax=Colletotrichum lupini TaxID=145971 RepID=A0A9Q8T812_9PEZI|nr:uncharacterized protein CLUP02_16035 [Colletotrichum lupini]UQC90505.1 hypothetical protein CLUP02_16035 [Colletotrichum lupini]